ncbi:amidohydrolase family protein [Rhodoferax koreense]|nr:amidohydrolase family protein [Rhodoferax koreense]
MSTATPSLSPIVIQNAHVLAMDDTRHEWPVADIVIQDGIIAALGPGAAAPWLARAARVIDGRGLLAMPGLVNAHFHSPGNFMKGCLEGMPLELFMLYEVPPLAGDSAKGGLAAQADRFTYVRTLLGAVEMLRRGITTVHDDAYHVPIVTHTGLDAMLQAYADAGIRATVAIDQPNIVEYDKYPFLRDLLPPGERAHMDAAPLQSEAELLAAYHHLITHWHGAAGGRLRAAVSCSAPQRVTPSYFRALSALSKQHDLPFNIHILETRLQRVLGQEVFGESLVKYVHRLGLLDERMMVIHAIWVDDEDIALLAASGCTVAHNPVCNLRLGSGIMPWRKLSDAGVPLCLGTDEMNTDDTTNLWAVTKLAGMVHSLADADCRRWPQAEEVLHAAIRGGARAIRRHADLGQLQPGFRADLVLLDLDTHAFTPLNDLRRQLVFCEDGSSVRYTIVDGRVVFEDGRIAGIDEKALRAEARALHAAFQAVAARQSGDAERLAPYYRAMLERAQAVALR